jgi:hypothetical protein
MENLDSTPDRGRSFQTDIEAHQTSYPGVPADYFQE